MQQQVTLIENEQEFEILAYMVQSTKNIKIIIDYGVSDDWFINQSLRSLFGAIKNHYVKFGSLYTKKQHIDVMTVHVHRNLATAEDVRRNEAFYDQLLDYSVCEHDLKPKLEQFKAAVSVFQNSQALRLYAEDVQAYGATEAHKRLQKKLETIGRMHHGDIGRPKNIKDLCRKVLNRKPGQVKFTKTGIEAVDDVFNGFRNGSLSGLAAVMGHGKTTMAVQMGRNAADAGQRVLFLSLEIPEEEITEKYIIQGCTNVTAKEVWTGGFNEAQINSIENASDKHDGLFDIRKPEKTNITPVDLHGILSEGRYDFVIIDHQLRFAHDFSDGQASSGSLGKIAQQLKDMAKEYDTAILLLLQVNRNANKNTSKYEKEVQIGWDNIAGSNRIMDVLDNCFALVRKEGSVSELSCLKVRYGSAFSPIKLEFDPANELFFDSECIGYRDNTEEVVRQYWESYSVVAETDAKLPVDTTYSEFCKYAMHYWGKQKSELPTVHNFGKVMTKLFQLETKKSRVPNRQNSCACYMGFNLRPVALKGSSDVVASQIDSKLFN